METTNPNVLALHAFLIFPLSLNLPNSWLEGVIQQQTFSLSFNA